MSSSRFSEAVSAYRDAITAHEVAVDALKNAPITPGRPVGYMQLMHDAARKTWESLRVAGDAVIVAAEEIL